jgi:hypothetical protein
MTEDRMVGGGRVWGVGAVPQYQHQCNKRVSFGLVGLSSFQPSRMLLSAPPARPPAPARRVVRSRV